MKTHLVSYVIVLAFTVLARADEPGESVGTVPMGEMTVNIPPGSLSAPSVTTFSLPLAKSIPSNFVGQASGRITSVTATTISNTNATWSAGALSQAATPYFLRITSGNAAGRTLQINTSPANTASTATVLNQGTDLTTLGIVTGTNGDTYEIFPGHTLAGFFGTSTLGGNSAAAADIVRLHNGSSWSEYFYNTTAGQWRIGTVPVSQNNVILRPDAGITFYRKGSTPLKFTALGLIPTTPIRVVINNSGVTYLGNVFPVDRTLAASGFNSLPGWINNTGSVTSADKVAIWGGSSYNYYNYHKASSQWRVGSVPVNQNNVMIPAGVPAIIERPAGTAGVTTLTRNLPYNLNQ